MAHTALVHEGALSQCYGYVSGLIDSYQSTKRRKSTKNINNEVSKLLSDVNRRISLVGGVYTLLPSASGYYRLIYKNRGSSVTMKEGTLRECFNYLSGVQEIVMSKGM